MYVGKESGFHTRTQDQIHQLLSYFCELGTVVRLKGGDPFVFGRGGEEVDFLRERGVQVSISPGITAAAGIAAEVGIPLTMRGTASAVKFVTGHAQDGSVELGKIEAGVTYVIYMGLGMLDVVTKRFKDAEQAGVACCAVERGTTDRQRVVSGVVGSIVGKVSDAGLKSPTLVVIGEVVRKCFLWDMEGVWEGRVGNVLGLEDLDVGFDLGLGKERIETPEQLVMPEQ